MPTHHSDVSFHDPQHNCCVASLSLLPDLAPELLSKASSHMIFLPNPLDCHTMPLNGRHCTSVSLTVRPCFLSLFGNA
jgi:hypothetical protein